MTEPREARTSDPDLPTIDPGASLSGTVLPGAGGTGPITDPVTGRPPVARPPRTETDKPILARLFAEQIERMKLTTEGATHHGTNPDVVLTPAELTEPLLAELVGMTIAIPSLDTWGVLRGARRTTDAGAAAPADREDPDAAPADPDAIALVVTLDDREVEVPASARLHVTERAWHEAGQPTVLGREA